MNCTICLFSRNLRVADNSCLAAAGKSGLPVVPVYIDDGLSASRRSFGQRSHWWLAKSLQDLDRELERLGSRLIVRRGSLVREITRLIGECNPASLHVMRDLPGQAATLEPVCARNGVQLVVHDDLLIFAPGSIVKPDGSAYKVFTPFWRRCMATPPPARPLATPRTLTKPAKWPASLPLQKLSPDTEKSDAQLDRYWQPGSRSALAKLRKYIQRHAADYGKRRDRPDLPDSTTRISAHLCFGEIGPRQLWHSLNPDTGQEPAKAPELLRQLIWREFCANLLNDFPQLPERELNPDYTCFAWQTSDRKGLAAWQRGKTGIPLVDAGMRELNEYGWMHNRVRMVVASFLVKNLLIDWRLGEKWFWNMLVDADLANNAANWQWVAGSGADAAPFFRIFNPVLQGRKFDPAGDYVRRFVPELAGLTSKYIHAPWLASPIELEAAGIKLGRDYPHPIVSLAASRERALNAYRKMRAHKSS